MAFASIEHALGFASSRAGVGKTALVVELAVWFASRGHSVALLDADLTAPDALGRLGARDEPREQDGIGLPIDVHGVASFSLGRWLEARGLSGVRGELLEQSLAPLLDDGIDFGRCELLLVDLAPLAEQNESWLEALGLDALVRVALEADASSPETPLPVLGRIETFSHAHEGARGPRGATLLGRIPFDPALRALGSSGRPLGLEAAHSPAAKAIAQAGANLWKRVQSRLSG
ncbi:MAG: P-loop NTPase [Planctomycetes bacterium]|nr:P-loop NTPase [Planctomycetota bacterium]